MKNINATKFEEYKLLFEDEDSSIRSAVAENPEATKFEEEYKLLFKDKEWEV